MNKLFVSETRSPRMDRGDRLLMWALTAVYTLLTLLNLGTLSFPETVWRAGMDSAVCLDLGEVRDVAGISFNGNIAEGTLLITADDGGSYEYKQQYGEMFAWKNKPVSFRTRYIRLQYMAGTVALNELAVYDESGNLLPAVVTEGNETAAFLLDEQDTAVRSSDYFNGMYFDEIYHARTAFEFLHRMSVYEWTHPPLGKIFIALGVLLFGMTPFGWRVVPALFGAAMLPALFLLSKRLFRRRDMAFLATALLALDTMHFAQTRIATVDVFVVFFILWMYYFMAVFLQADFLHGRPSEYLRPLGACGISFALGVASKWTGLYAGLGLALLFFIHLIRQGIAAKKAGETAIFRKRFIGTCLFCLVFFVLIPVAVYFVSYTPFFLHEQTLRADYGFSDAVKTVLQQQESMFSYHSKLTATHLCQSNWYEWPFTAKSVWFFFGGGEKTVSNISSFGSPAVWWLGTVGALCLLTEIVILLLRRKKLPMGTALAVVLVGIAANLFPWMTVPRCTFQYHFFPTLPFIILAAVLLLQLLEEQGELSPRMKWVWLGVAALYFVLLLPAASGLPMSKTFARFVEYVLPTGVLFHGAI